MGFGIDLKESSIPRVVCLVILHLEPVREDDDGLVLEGGEQLLAHPLLLLRVVLPLRLVRLLPLGRRRRRHLKEEYSQLRSAQWIIGYDGSIRLYWIRYWPVPSLVIVPT